MGKLATATDFRVGSRASLSQIRHDIRNHLNMIRLSCALLQRQGSNPDEPLREIERSVDGINELVTRFLGEADSAEPIQAFGPHR